MIQQFFKPSTVQEALALKDKYGTSIAWFGGGTHINHADFCDTYDKVISLEKLGLRTLQKKDNRVSIKACVTFQELADSDKLPNSLRQAAARSCPRTIRNMATIGGDIGAGTFHTQLAPCLIALSSIVTTGDDIEILLEDYLRQNNQSLILEISIPTTGRICGVRSAANQANGPVIVSTAVGMDRSSTGKIENVIVVLKSNNEEITRLTTIENGIHDGAFTDREGIEKAVAECVNPKADILGSAVYKKHIICCAIADCVMDCLEGDPS
ncbi:FAD binding domain-containing protein [bacterium]|nr:FAD binding domain-containing protein [bacterium]